MVMPDTAAQPQQYRKAQQWVRRWRMQNMIVNRGNSGGREAKHKAIEQTVVKPAARLRKILTDIVATASRPFIAAAQITQGQNVRRRLASAAG